MRSAKEIMASWLSGYADNEGRADRLIADLTAAGYRIVGPDEGDPVTVERVAKFIDNFDNPPMYDGIVVEIAAAIRALASGGKP